MTPLTFQEYQQKAKTTAKYPGVGEFMGMAYCALGLTGEAGETANQIKKVVRDDSSSRTPDRLAKIRHEIGDTLWYLSQLCTELGMNLEEVGQENLDMLAKRAADGKISGEGSIR